MRKEKEKYLVFRSGESIEDTYKIEKVSKVITCPHCKKLIGVAPQRRETKIIEEEEEITLYLGDCCDCKFCERLDEPIKIEASGKDEPFEIEAATWVATCAIQGNVNTIMFTERGLKMRTNACADEFRIKVKNPNEPHCFAFKPRIKGEK